MSSGWLHAQQLPHYTQYVLNNYILNPAVTGIENYTDVKLSVRDQWVGLKGAPRTAYASVHAPIGKSDFKTNATSFEMPGENPRGEAYWQNYTASAPHHGVGFMMVSDRTGNFNRVSAVASYAYHMGLSSKLNLSMGFAAGLSSVTRATDKTDFGSGVNVDPAQNNTDGFGIKPDLSAGVWLYSGDYYVGLSAQQIIPQRLAFTSDNTVGGKSVPHLFFTAGYRMFLSEDFNFLPSVLVKRVSNMTQVDVNAKFQYHDKLWLGAAYRSQEGYAAMAGVNISSTLNIGYAYDITTTALNTTSRGTHELMIGFLLGNKYGDWCPRRVW